MNGNNMPIDYSFGASVTSSDSQISNTTDIIDLTDTNDDESEVTSSDYVTVKSENYVPSLPKDASSSKEQSESADDSICILYECIPEVVVVNEIIVDGSESNEPEHNSPTVPISPTILGEFNEYPESVIQHIPPLFPQLSNESIHIPYQPVSYSFDVPEIVPSHSTRSSCKYAATNETPRQLVSQPYPRIFQGLTQIVPDESSKTVTTGTFIPPVESTVKEKSDNVPTKVAKIECGICMDGPDEIAASGRNFTSTNCGHVFCNTCIKTSMKNAAKCPKCRKKITSRSIHPLFL